MKKQLGLRLNEDSIERLDALVISLNMSRTEVIAFLLKSYEDNSASGEFVTSLLGQLEEKDKQISMLMEQGHNYQVLLKQEQDSKMLLLAHPKRVGFLQRIFGRSALEE